VAHLIDLIVAALPQDKQYPFIRTVKPELVSTETKKKADDGLVGAVKHFVKDSCDILEPYIPTIARLIRGWL